MLKVKYSNEFAKRIAKASEIGLDEKWFRQCQFYVKIHYLVVSLSKFGAIIGNVVTAGEYKVSKRITEFLITSRTYEFEFGIEAFVDCFEYRFVVIFGCFEQ